MNVAPDHPLQGWVPYQLSMATGEPLVRWLYTSDIAFNHPFFDETISHCRQLPQNHAFLRSMSNVDILPVWAEPIAPVPPAAVIFHVSRCGSTLLSQLLALQPANIVLSEVPFFDQLLRHQRNAGAAEQHTLPLLRSAIDLYSARRSGAEEKLIIKTDSWHIFFYPILRQLFPNVPFFLLYRHPAEVIRSHQKKRGMQAVPGLIEPSLFGFDADEVAVKSLDEYMAAVLEKYFTAFVHILQTDELAIALNYKQGALNMMQQIAHTVPLQINEQDWQTITARAAKHAKFPGEAFAAEPPVATIPNYLSPAMLWYHQLENLRMKAGNGYNGK